MTPEVRPGSEDSVKHNRLQYESSPYLLQHAGNPVDWYPWSEEAFEKARREDKPVFLSIGYSSCHWCHVMEEESFSQAGVAELLNASFIPVKVDREERPDVDQAYIAMSQRMTGSAGWPLNVIATPEGWPFYIGTYIPKESRPGMIGMIDLLPAVAGYWVDGNKRDELLESAKKIVDATQAMLTPEREGTFAPEVHARAVKELADAYDSVNGGFGVAPKFPTPTRLAYLLRSWRETGDTASLEMITVTLDHMRHGGIYDHVGSGFHRYSVDQSWSVPHFEKMLYDQAQLAEVYVDAYLATGNQAYADTARDVLNYVLQRLTGPNGAFYGTEDADSAGKEGVYYLWSGRQLASVLSEIELSVLLTAAGIMRDDTTGDEARFVLGLVNGTETVAAELEMSEQQVETNLRSALTRLREERLKREPPGLDDKISADWNGLAIAAFAKAGRALGAPDLIAAAERAAAFVLKELVSEEGRLLHSYRDGEASVPGMLEDYAFMVYGLLELYQASHQYTYLQSAVKLNADMLSLFWDQDKGGFFQTGSDAEQLVVRIKPSFDGALPSGNSAASMNCARIARLTSDPEMDEVVDRLFASLSVLVDRSPSLYTHLLLGHRLRYGDVFVTIVVGEADGEDTKALLNVLDGVYAPANLVVYVPTGEAHDDLLQMVPVARNHSLLDGHAGAYVCDREMCASPTSNPEELRALLLR
ncbi:MAG: thioredoxin domain-containing protein [Dehalococcoidia bacterium]|nr:thioredoxin domain-containing protein [Dehalococcoidia bacterium]